MRGSIVSVDTAQPEGIGIGLHGRRFTAASTVKGRFLLTFDDGPHANTTKVIQQLAGNPVQVGVKAIFFVQTRHPEGGGSAFGRSLLERQHREGHVLGLHSGTTRGHVRHTGMAASELDQSLQNGIEDIAHITQQEPLLVRPPYWLFNAHTLARYGRHGLHMILSDVKAYDGVNWGMHVFRRWNFRSQLTTIRNRFLQDCLPVLSGTIPIVVAFHDTNAYTANHLGDYLSLLVTEADRVGLPLDGNPFYDQPSDIIQAALLRCTFLLHIACRDLPRGTITDADARRQT